jgi:predicted DNA-binding transcriptional regulator YafY
MTNPFANIIKFLTAINLMTSPTGATLQGLMKHLNISRRTAFRLLSALEELGFPLIDGESVSRNVKTYRLMDSYVLKLPNLNIPNPSFTPQERGLLLSILDLVDSVQQPSQISVVNSIRSKIIAMPSKGIEV